MVSKTGILAPAGSMESLVAAVYSGADEVYLGVQDFNARASAANFSFEQLKEAVGFCHRRNVRVNVTLNTILYDSELERFQDTVREVARRGADAVIVQDLAAAKIVRESCPEMDIHGSTQMSIHNLRGALLLRELGFKRVILARELTLSQVKEITGNCGIETEIFVHGALCMSLSGQCYASAFLGGRSGNRGRCAGTCRLPFSAGGGTDDYHLSLKDLCAMELLPQIQQAGVKCVKIEGRLRPPEYVALAVDSRKKALSGQVFDIKALEEAFSRQGFTDGFLTGKIDGDMFGVRTRSDAENTKSTLPSLRSLYRREMQRVPVSFRLTMGGNGTVLSVTDGNNRFSCPVEGEVFQWDGDFDRAARNSLSKLGGTPFYLENAEIDSIPGCGLPLSSVKTARRYLIQKLLLDRETVRGKKYIHFELPPFESKKKTFRLIGRFETARQIPCDIAKNYEYIVLPWKEAEKVLPEYKGKIVVDLGRGIFGKEKDLGKIVDKFKSRGIFGFFISNTGQIPLVGGCSIFSDFTLNISNNISAQEYSKLGVTVMTLSPEITLRQASAICPGCRTAVIGYGHIPLMMTKSCPLHNIHGCDCCSGEGILRDRKGKQFRVACRGGLAGYREIYNPVPLYIGDKLMDINADFVILSFTNESRKAARDITEKFLSGSPLGAEFTRGLYYNASI